MSQKLHTFTYTWILEIAGDLCHPNPNPVSLHVDHFRTQLQHLWTREHVQWKVQVSKGSTMHVDVILVWW
jgi:hypothetical protein